MAAPRKRQRQPADYAEDTVNEVSSGGDTATNSQQDAEGTPAADASDYDLTPAELAAIKAGEAAAPARAALARHTLAPPVETKPRAMMLSLLPLLLLLLGATTAAASAPSVRCV